MTFLTGSRPMIRTGPPLLHRAEAWLIGAVVATGIAAMALSLMRDQAVDWAGFASGLAPSCVLVGVGLFARARQSFDRLSLFMIAGGIFIGFMTVSAIFTFLMFPFARPIIDPALIAIDARLGYSWGGLVIALADKPSLAAVLRVVYLTSIWQLLVVLTVLAWLDRKTELYRFLIVGTAGLGVTLAIWAMFPAVGPSAYVTLPADVAAGIRLIADNAVGAELLRMAREGNAVVSPDVITGVVAFPSFHMLMACMAAWYLRATVLRWPAFALNILMIPATLTHGGHHLVDLIGGVVIFTLVTWAATKLIRDT